MRYKQSLKYILLDNYRTELGFFTGVYIDIRYIELIDNNLLVRKGYQWDGASGPAIDTDNIMVGSLVHDALYYLMRNGYISSAHRRDADMELKRICLAHGMCPARACYIYWAVRLFGPRMTRRNFLKKYLALDRDMGPTLGAGEKK